MAVNGEITAHGMARGSCVGRELWFARGSELTSSLQLQRCRPGMAALELPEVTAAPKVSSFGQAWGAQA